MAEDATGPEKEMESQPPKPRAPIPPDTILIGNKPVMSYAMSALLQLGQSEEIVLKARGMAISNTVDVAEIVSKRLGNNAFEVKNIKIDTEAVGQGDDQRNVSTIEIVLGKK